MVYKHAKVPFLQKKCTHSHRPQLIADFLSFIILYFTLNGYFTFTFKYTALLYGYTYFIPIGLVSFLLELFFSSTHTTRGPRRKESAGL